jgi:sphingosine kinase
MCAGTGNGMAKSLMYAASEKCSVSNAVFAIIRGHFSISSLSHARKYMTHGNFLGRILRNTNFSLYTGHKQSLDVCTILQGEKKFFSVLLMTWVRYRLLQLKYMEFFLTVT